MTPRISPVLGLLGAARLGGVGGCGDSTPQTAGSVTALEYRILWADSALDLSHGGGRWVDELYFPETNLTATLVDESQPTTHDPLEFATLPRVYVGRADRPRTALTGLSDETPPPPTEIQVPAKLAQAVEALAELDARHRAESTRLGRELRAALGLDPDATPSAGDAPGR